MPSTTIHESSALDVARDDAAMRVHAVGFPHVARALVDAPNLDERRAEAERAAIYLHGAVDFGRLCAHASAERLEAAHDAVRHLALVAGMSDEDDWRDGRLTKAPSATLGMTFHDRK